MGYRFRSLCHRDIEDVRAIEAASFPDPFDRGTILSFLDDRLSLMMVATWRGEVVGHVIASLDPGGDGAPPLIVVSTLAVLPSHRGRGVGRRLLREVASFGAESGHTLRAYVSEGCVEAQLFLRACGLRAVGIDRDPYGTGLDYYLFSSGRERWIGALQGARGKAVAK